MLACVRHPEHVTRRWPTVIAIKADFTSAHDASDWLPLLGNVDVVINAVGIIREGRSRIFDALHTLAPIALFQVCESVGVRRVI